ncbi:MAG: hypothetical protein ACHP78_03915 [Terriglobales bacterium]
MLITRTIVELRELNKYELECSDCYYRVTRLVADESGVLKTKTPTERAQPAAKGRQGQVVCGNCGKVWMQAAHDDPGKEVLEQFLGALLCLQRTPLPFVVRFELAEPGDEKEHDTGTPANAGE